MKNKLKLSLNKETIANLNKGSLELIYGGGLCSDYCVTDNPEHPTYCPGAPNSDCNSACGTSCNYTVCDTWCDCISIPTGTCC